MVLLVVGTSSDISNVSSAQPSPAQPSPVQPSPAQPLKLKVKITIDCRCLPTSPSFLMLSTSFMCVSNWRGDCRDGIIIPAIVSRNVACKAVMTSAHSSRRLTFWKQLSCLVTIQWIPSSLLLRCTMCPEFADLLLLCIVSGEEAWIRPSGAITEVTIHKDDQLLLVTSRPHRSGHWRHLRGPLATQTKITWRVM